jgi:hypothetical protein
MTQVHPDLCRESFIQICREDSIGRKLYFLTGLGEIKIINLALGTVVQHYDRSVLKLDKISVSRRADGKKNPPLFDFQLIQSKFRFIVGVAKH